MGKECTRISFAFCERAGDGGDEKEVEGGRSARATTGFKRDLAWIVAFLRTRLVLRYCWCSSVPSVGGQTTFPAFFLVTVRDETQLRARHAVRRS